MKTVLRLKDGVLWDGIKIQACVAIFKIWALFDELGIPELVVTSILDGRHMLNSKHYSGEGVDIRSHGLDPISLPGVRLTTGKALTPLAFRERLVELIKDKLGKDYDVILEHDGTPNGHIHVEYDPEPKPQFLPGLGAPTTLDPNPSTSHRS